MSAKDPNEHISDAEAAHYLATRQRTQVEVRGLCARAMAQMARGDAPGAYITLETAQEFVETLFPPELNFRGYFDKKAGK